MRDVLPALVQLLNFPAHIATATSHFAVAVMSLTGATTHAIGGEYNTAWERVLFLAVGVVFGAQAGARLSQRVHGRLILRLLALALAVVGVRLMLYGFA